MLGRVPCVLGHSACIVLRQAIDQLSDRRIPVSSDFVLADMMIEDAGATPPRMCEPPVTPDKFFQCGQELSILRHRIAPILSVWFSRVAPCSEHTQTYP